LTGVASYLCILSFVGKFQGAEMPRKLKLWALTKGYDKLRFVIDEPFFT